MRVFRLEPIKSTQGSDRWEASTLAPVTVWVKAASEADAREKLALATPRATCKIHGGDTPISPWLDSKLVNCTLDSSRDVKDGVVLTADGKSLPPR